MNYLTMMADLPVRKPFDFDREAVAMNGMIKELLNDIRERVAGTGADLAAVERQGMRLTEEQKLLHGTLAYAVSHVSQEILTIRGLSIDDRGSIDRVAEHVGLLSNHLDRLETQAQSFLTMLRRKHLQLRAA
jgi:hypothetical protein